MYRSRTPRGVRTWLVRARRRVPGECVLFSFHCQEVETDMEERRSGRVVGEEGEYRGTRHSSQDRTTWRQA